MKLTENVTYQYDHYYQYHEIKEILEGYAKQYPDYCKLDKIGTTLEGRDIPILMVTDLKTGDYSDKPGYYVEGNIHAGEVCGSMVCMYFLDTVFTNLQSNEIQKLLKKYTIYVVPRVSPDGSEYYLTTPYSVRSVNTPYPYPSKMPGLYNEDIDGDGVIRSMRIKSPNGVWKISEKDPRVMVQRKPDDDEGDFYNVYSEGLLHEFNGEIKEAPNPYGNDFNRNYPAYWQNEGKQQGAGLYPLSNIETKSNALFLLDHPNICSVVDMHTAGGQYLYTPGAKSRKECNPQDIAIYKALANIGHEETNYPVLNVHDEYCNPEEEVTYGGFDDFCHFNVGIPAITIECWDFSARAGIKEEFPYKPHTPEQEEDEMVKYLKWFDENKIDAFKPWTSFDHPQLGKVEIGGLNFKYTIQNPPIPFMLQELKKHVNFYLREIKTLPVIDFNDIKVEHLANNLYKVEATILNKGFLPTYVFKEGLNNKRVLPITVELKGAKVIQGKAKEEIGQLGGYACTMTFNGPWGPMNFETEPTFKKLSWVIETKNNIELIVTGSRIGKKEITVQVGNNND